MGEPGRFFPGRGVFHLDPPGGHPLGAVANPGEGLKYFIKKVPLPNYLVGAKKIPPVLVFMVKNPPNYLAGGYTLPKSFDGGHKKNNPPKSSIMLPL